MAKNGLNIRVPHGTKVQMEESTGFRTFCGVLGTLNLIGGPLCIATGAPEIGAFCIVMGILGVRSAFKRYRNMY